MPSSGRTAEELAASAPIHLSGFSRPQSAQPASPGTGPARGEAAGRKGRPQDPSPRRRQCHLPRLFLKSPSPWPKPQISPAPGVCGEGGDPRGERSPPTRRYSPPWSVGTETLGHLPSALRDRSCGGGSVQSRGTPVGGAPGRMRPHLAKNDGCHLRSPRLVPGS